MSKNLSELLEAQRTRETDSFKLNGKEHTVLPITAAGMSLFNASAEHYAKGNLSEADNLQKQLVLKVVPTLSAEEYDALPAGGETPLAGLIIMSAIRPMSEVMDVLGKVEELLEQKKQELLEPSLNQKTALETSVSQ